MAYPNTIPPTNGAGWAIGYSVFGNFGAENNADEYVVLYQEGGFGFPGDMKFHVLKSSDLGNTWNDMANFSVTGGASGAAACTVCKDGNILYILATNTNGTNAFTDPTCTALQGWTYDMNADSLAPISLSGSPTIYKWATGPTFQPNWSGDPGAGMILVRRGSGDMLFVYTGIETTGGGNYARSYVATFNGSSFGASTMIANQSGDFAYGQGSAVVDSDGILHVLLFGTAASTNHIAMDSGGTFGALTVAASNGMVVPINGASNLITFPNNGVPSIGFLGVDGDAGPALSLAFYSAPSGSLNPSWTKHLIGETTPIAPGANGPVNLAVAYSQSVVHVFWVNSGTAPDWSVSDGLGNIQTATAAATDISTWTLGGALMSSPNSTFGARHVFIWEGPNIGIGVVGDYYIANSDGFMASTFYAILPSGGSLNIDCNDPPNGTVGIPYSHSLSITAPGSFSVTITAGGLPPGLSMDSSGHITGTPTATGNYVFTAHVTSL